MEKDTNTKVKEQVVDQVAKSLSNDNSVGYLDKGLSKFTSRKLLVWLVSTGFLIKGIIPPSDWILISLLWIGVQGALDLYKIRATITDKSR